MANQTNDYFRHSPIICNEFAAYGTKIIDFRDGLMVSDVEHYAQIHHDGDFAKGVYPSRIHIYLVNKKDANSQDAVTVHAAISPELPFIWYEICLRNFGSTGFRLMTEERDRSTREVKRTPTRLGQLLKDMQTSSHLIKAYAKAGDVFINNRMKLLHNMLNGNGQSDARQKNMESANSFKQMSDFIRAGIRAANQDPSLSKEDFFLELDHYEDYSYKHARVHSKPKRADGYVPVVLLEVNHYSFRPGQNNNQERYVKYPWHFKIQQFEAKPKESKTGATSYYPNTMRNVRTADITLGEQSFFAMMYKVTRFITLWEMAYGVNVIREGSARQREGLANYHAQKSNKTQGGPNRNTGNNNRNNYGNDYDYTPYGNY